MIPAQQYLDLVLSMDGTPVVHRGRSREGVDCSGLIHVVLDELGLPTWQPLYGSRPDTRMLDEGLEFHADRVSNLVQGTIMQVFYGAEARHLMVFLGMDGTNKIVIHANPDVRKVTRSVLGTRRVHQLWWPKGVSQW
jgi:hypothetical protein